jgi:hypothetical protein
LTGDPVGVLKSALARDPGFALGGVAIAALTMLSLDHESGVYIVTNSPLAI